MKKYILSLTALFFVLAGCSDHKATTSNVLEDTPETEETEELPKIEVTNATSDESSTLSIDLDADEDSIEMAASPGDDNFEEQAKQVESYLAILGPVTDKMADSFLELSQLVARADGSASWVKEYKELTDELQEAFDLYKEYAVPPDFLIESHESTLKAITAYEYSFEYIIQGSIANDNTLIEEGSAYTELGHLFIEEASQRMAKVNPSN